MLSLVSRCLLYASLLQFSIQFNSVVYLLLWPVNHSCARFGEIAPSHEGDYKRTTTFNDSHNKPIELDAIQRELVNASPEDPHTAARAFVLGVNLDDVGRCYEHPTFYDNGSENLMVNTENLVDCQNGLQFEEEALSLVAHFRLACKRQYLKVLLPIAFALGHLTGIILNRLFLSNSSNKLRQFPIEVEQEPLGSSVNNLESKWILMQTISTFGASLSSYLAYHKDYFSKFSLWNGFDFYTCILITVLLRSQLNFANFVALKTIIWPPPPSASSSSTASVKTFTDWPGDKQNRKWPSPVTQQEQHKLVRAFMLLSVLVQATYLPLTFRILTNWIQLDTFLNITGSLLFLAICVLKFLQKWDLFPFKTDANQANVELNLRQVDTQQQQQLAKYEGDCLEAANNNKQQNPLNYHKEPEMVSGWPKVCEFCLLTDQSAFETPTNVRRRRRIIERSSKSSNVTIESNNVARTPVEGEESGFRIGIRPDVCANDSSPEFVAYRPTTMPIDDLFASTSASQTTKADDDDDDDCNNVQFNRTLAGSSSRGIGGQQIRHNFGFAARNLSNWRLASQLHLLLFACLLNYHLIQLLPDHRLLHSETIASRNQRKLVHHLASHPSTTIKPFPVGEQPEVAELGNKTAEHFKYLLEGDQAKHSKTTKPFDYSNLNYSAKLLKSLRNSNNPFGLLYDTANLNGWPLFLAVVLLHWKGLTNFKEAYFKLSKLFSLVRFTSQLLFFLWLLVGLLKRQNHLLESEWLASFVVFVSRFCAFFQLYNYLESMLKLNRKLGPSIKIIDFSAGASAFCLALALASLTPLMEKLDLIVIPILLLANNSLAYLLAKNLKKRFKTFLCPMIFEDNKP